MSEAIKTIISAWSVGFIVLAVLGSSTSPLTFFLAVTGAGWLWYRSEEKSEGEVAAKPEEKGAAE